MAITGVRGLLVPGPQLQVAKYGLLSVMQGPTTPIDVHWQAGLEFEDLYCENVSSTLPNCPEAVVEKEPAGGPDSRFVEPFTLYGSYFCGTGGRPAGDAFSIARGRLFANEHRGVEEVFWTGLTDAGAVIPSLAFGDVAAGIVPVDVSPAGALDPVSAIAALESALAECLPGPGVIHANYGLGAYLAAQSLLTVNGDGTYSTPTGQLLALGAGYPGSGPNNIPIAPGETWVFATGPIIGWRSEIFMTPNEVGEAVDRSLNNITVFAERTWAIGFSCCIFAVRATLSCDCGSGIFS